MRVVLDTNVVVSRFIAPRGAPARVLQLWRSRRFDLLISPEILSEYDRVLHDVKIRSFHRMNDTEIARVIADFEELAVLIRPTEHFSVVVNDPKDDKYIDCAAAGNAHILVSGDKHLLNLGSYQQTGILPPSAFISLFTNGHPPDSLLF